MESQLIDALQQIQTSVQSIAISFGLVIGLASFTMAVIATIRLVKS